MALALTETAAKQVKKLMEDAEAGELSPADGRQGRAAARACRTRSSSTPRSGPTTRSSTSTGVQVVCDTKSYLYLNGTTLDYVTEGLQGGFTFVNPSAKSSCGCGTSFSA